MKAAKKAAAPSEPVEAEVLPPNVHGQELLGRRDLARRAGVSYRTIQRLEQKGALTPAPQRGSRGSTLFEVETLRILEATRLRTTHSPGYRIDSEKERQFFSYFDDGRSVVDALRELGNGLASEDGVNAFLSWCRGGGLAARAARLWLRDGGEVRTGVGEEVRCLEREEYAFTMLALQGVPGPVARELLRELVAGVSANPEPVALDDRLREERSTKTLKIAEARAVKGA